MKQSLKQQLIKTIKLLSISIVLLGLFNCSEEPDPTSEDTEENIVESTTFENTYSIPLGGNAYQTAGDAYLNIDDNGVNGWDDMATKFSIYFSADTKMTIRLDLDLHSVTGESTIAINANGLSHEVDITDGASGVIEVGEFELIEGYNEFSFTGIQKSTDFFPDISDLVINYNNTLNLNYILNNEGENFLWGRRGPSVHMNYEAPSDTDFEWFYNEMTIPVGEDPVGSYFMANGFGEGYFGIQVNSENERKVLFSVWSPFATDNPNDIPEESKIQLIKKGENVIIGEFGNEGSGGQSYMVYNWDAGVTYKFLNSVTPDGNGNTIYTAYFMDPAVGNWVLMASFLRPQTDTWYVGQYSFLENFEPTMGYIDRMVHFDNQWMFDSNGNAVELTSGIFTGDNVAEINYRLDFSGGIANDVFYLRNGGFFNGEVSLNTFFSRTAKGIAPAIDFNSLP